MIDDVSLPDGSLVCHNVKNSTSSCRSGVSMTPTTTDFFPMGVARFTRQTLPSAVCGGGHRAFFSWRRLVCLFVLVLAHFGKSPRMLSTAARRKKALPCLERKPEVISEDVVVYGVPQVDRSLHRRRETREVLHFAHTRAHSFTPQVKTKEGVLGVSIMWWISPVLSPPLPLL